MDYDQENDETHIAAEELKNENPIFLVNFYEDVLSFFVNYGWYCLILLIGLLYVYCKLESRIENYFKKKAEREYDAKYHKNSDLYNERLSAIERARQKMQENLNKAAEEHKEKMKQREEQRRELFLQQTEGMSGNRLGGARGADNASTSTGKKSFKSDYNPLMGSGGSSYRAPKKSACGGGGCGKK